MVCAVGEFYPPDGMSPTKFELNNIEVFKDCKEYVSGVVDEHCDLPVHLSLPKPVQELMDAEGTTWCSGYQQCDFRFDLFFSFSFANYVSVCKSYTASTPNIKPADEDVLMICLNTIHR